MESIVLVNASHGGFDGGAEAPDGTKEKDINLIIAGRLRDFLEFGGFEIIMTRETDTGTEEDSDDTIGKRKVSDMKNRLALINSNRDAVFVSVHLNKFTTSSVNGAQVFYSPNNELSLELAQNLQKTIASQIQQDNERAVKKADKSIYLLKNATIPAVIVECGFLSNPEELSLLKNPDYQDKMAFSIYCGIMEYYNTGVKNGYENQNGIYMQ